MRHEEGLFLRKKKQAKSKLKEDPFTNEQKRKIRAAINRLNRLLKSKGKESLPLHKYDFYWSVIQFRFAFSPKKYNTNTVRY